MDGLTTLLYDRVYGRVSRPNLARIFIAPGGDAKGVGVGVGVGDGPD